MRKYSRWKPGNPVVLRGVGFGRLWWAMPAIVVQDEPERIALYWRAGTRWKDVREHPAAQVFLSAARIELVGQLWTDTDVLMLAGSGEAHSIWAMREAGGGPLRCWYVNLETPLRRTRLGFDTMDHELDIVISPNQSERYWKDEPAYNQMVAVGVFSREQARAIRAEGEGVIRRMLAGGQPFCEGWEKWNPPPAWSIPELPPGWDELGLDFAPAHLD
jgi:hypothetical protein